MNGNKSVNVRKSKTAFTNRSTHNQESDHGVIQSIGRLQIPGVCCAFVSCSLRRDWPEIKSSNCNRRRRPQGQCVGRWEAAAGAETNRSHQQRGVCRFRRRGGGARQFASRNTIRTAQPHTSQVIVAGNQSGTVKLWDLEQAKVIRTLLGHRAPCISVEFHPYGDFFASGSLDTNLKIWDIRRKSCIQTYKGHTQGVTGVLMLPALHVLHLRYVLSRCVLALRPFGLNLSPQSSSSRPMAAGLLRAPMTATSRYGT
jgi:hypothetical protein